MTVSDYRQTAAGLGFWYACLADECEWRSTDPRCWLCGEPGVRRVDGVVPGWPRLHAGGSDRVAAVASRVAASGRRVVVL